MRLLPAGWVIRALAPSDSIVDLTAFLHRAYEGLAESGLRYVASHQDEATTLRRIRGGECFLAFVDGRLAGTVTFHEAAHARGCPWYDRPDVANFHMLAVDPDFRGRGLAGLLIEHVEDRAEVTGAAEVACDTAEQATLLIGLYERRGYRFVDFADWRPTTNYRSVILSKRVIQRERDSS